MGAGNSTSNPATSLYAATPASQNGIIEKKYTNRNGKVTSLYGFNTSKAYSAANSTPVKVKENEWIKNTSQSNKTRNVYKHKSNNGKIRTNYKHNNGTKNTLYGFNKNKAYVDPELNKLMKITKNSVQEMIDNFKDKFKDNPEIEPVIEQLKEAIQPLMNNNAPTQKDIEDAHQRIKKIIDGAIHDETVVKRLPATMLLTALGSTFQGIIEILSASTMLGLSLLVSGGTRRKRQNRRHRTQRHE